MLHNIKLSLYRLLPVSVLALLDNVIKKMTGNPLFTAPPVSLGDMGTLRDELQAAIEDATGGSVAARKFRDKKVEEAKGVLRITADYVRAQCAGDAAKLASSGFELRKLPEPINVVGVPQRLVALPTDEPGTLRLRWGRTVGSRLFRVEQAEGDPTLGITTWNTIALVGRSTHEVTGLEPYAPVWFRVTAIGAEGEGQPSDVVLGRAA